MAAEAAEADWLELLLVASNEEIDGQVICVGAGAGSGCLLTLQEDISS